MYLLNPNIYLNLTVTSKNIKINANRNKKSLRGTFLSPVPPRTLECNVLLEWPDPFAL